MQVDLLSYSPGCFAGVMLRGSSNDSVISYRFVAIRANNLFSPQTGTDREKRFSSAHIAPLQLLKPPIVVRLFEREALLIGEATRTNLPRTFAFCDKLFKRWSEEDGFELKNIKLRSTRKGKITDLVVESMGKAGRAGAYEGWLSIVDKDIASAKGFFNSDKQTALY